MLKKIGSRVDDRTGVIAIEASDPVPYVASQPDAAHLRRRAARRRGARLRRRLHRRPASPVAAVQVESAQAADGATVARVRMTLRSRCGRAFAAPAT